MYKQITLTFCEFSFIEIRFVRPAALNNKALRAFCRNYF